MSKPFAGPVNMLDAKSRLSKLVAAIESGATPEVVLARNGKPAARLVPVAPVPARRLGLLAGQFEAPTLEALNADDAGIAAGFSGAAVP